MAIKKPTLPPKAGYVEVTNAEGKPTYKPTPETEIMNELREQLAGQLRADIDFLAIMTGVEL